ncbi:hypothetical protein G7046_g4846 [Stylonectria norvegica]|nr:hypothetical protein G7046_g4846 [Stylonectria norvegica]
MASTLPALTFDPNDLRIVLVPTSDDDGTTTASERPYSEGSDDHDDDDYREVQKPSEHNIPTHPVPSMQDAFAESLHEVTNGGASEKTRLREFDAKGRRERLLEQAANADPFDAPWRYRPGQQQHEVYKLIAQITFGVYLLLNGMAADNTQVVNILQGHIDEVDEFLEVMLEDFAQAHKDMAERIAHLQLPMANRRAFEEMLVDRNFRAQILAGNERIEHILSRTNAVMKQWDDDVDAGLRSSEAFNEWLSEQKDSKWRIESPDLADIFDAMKGNADGWLNAFDQLNSQAQELNGLIIKLMTIVAEMEKTAGEVSRKTWASIPPFTLPIHAHRNGETSSTSSPSTKSNPRSTSTPQASIHSGGSSSTMQPSRSRDDEEDSLTDFPLPGSTPLLPPPRSSRRISTVPTLTLAISKAIPLSPPLEDKKADSGNEAPQTGLRDGPLYILQPRTYTPVPPEPLPSPMVRNVPSLPRLDTSSLPEAVEPYSMEPYSRASQQVLSPMVYQSPSQSPAQPYPDQGSGFAQKRTSLRQRVSLKTTPPDSIFVPPRNATERQSHHLSPGAYASPRTGNSQARDSAYGFDGDASHQHRLPRASSHADFSAPVRPPLMPSPRSDHQQYYHPVRASPHSPLQQRPHTAGPPEAQHRPPGYNPGHQRNQPSRMGGVSMLSNVTMATYDDRATVASGATTLAGGKRVKKKKSAFGWLKKAFSLDENERAEYEARRAMQNRDQYFDGKSPKFLDGKRMR